MKTKRLWLSAMFPVLMSTALLAAVRPYEPFSETSPDHQRSRGLEGLKDFEPPFRLVDVSEKMGIKQKYDNPKTDDTIFYNEAPRFLTNGAAASVVDINRDGFMDLFVANGAEGSRPWFWINQAGQGFRDEVEQWGLAGLNSPGHQSGAVAFFDYDNDGDEDLFVHRLSGCSTFFVNEGSKFTERKELLGTEVCGYGMGVNAVDYDMDGDLDLIAVFWSQEKFNLLKPQHTNVLWDSPMQASNGSRIYLLKNNGTSFSDATAEAGLGGVNGWLWTPAVVDLNTDGFPDFYFANGWGRDKLYMNDTHGSFRDASLRLRFGSLNAGMGVEVADFNGDLLEDIFVAVIYEGRHINWGNNFYLNTPGKPLENTAKKAALFNCGWSWGPKAADLDLDGKLELYLSNGNISRENAGKYDFEALTATNLPRFMQSDDRTRSSNLSRKSYAGFQRDCLFYEHQGRYWDIGPLVGLDTRVDGRATVSMDYDNDGRVDIFVANQGGKPELFHNEATEVSKDNSWIGLRLSAGQTHGVNRNAFGAKVYLMKNGRRQLLRTLQPFNGYLSQSDPRLIFGLGPSAAAPVFLQVLWPDGKVQVVKADRLNTYLDVVRDQ